MILGLVLSAFVAAHAPKPHIVSQHQKGADRVMVVRNPLRTTWVKFECENVISDFIRIPGHKTSVVVLASNEPDTEISPPPCLVMAWSEGENAP